MKYSQLVLLILVIALVTHLGILLNPGFHSHDEWDKFDHVQAYGLRHFIWWGRRLIPGPEFGFPIRPLGFVQQGIT